MVITAKTLGKLIGIFLLGFSVVMIVKDYFYAANFSIAQIFAAITTGILLMVICTKEKILK